MLEIPDRDPRAPATDFAYADGKLRYCLFAIDETDLKHLLRSGAPDSEIAADIRRNVSEKRLGHRINSAQFVPRPVYAIGG